MYRILNYLKRFSKDRIILIVKDEKSWLSLIEDDIRNAILVPYFNSEEILVKKIIQISSFIMKGIFPMKLMNYILEKEPFITYLVL